MIVSAAPVPIGNAVRLILQAPAGSVLTRVLRNTSGEFAGPSDPAASIVFEGQDDGCIDFCGLTNGTSYAYCAFDFVAGAWVSSPVVEVTPAANSSLVTDDVLTLVRDRLRAGLAVEVQAGRLQHANGAIPVLTAPPLFETTTFPIVTVHLNNEAPSIRGLGEAECDEIFDPTSGLFTDSQGWLADVSLDVMAWVVGNPDVRIALRQAIKKVLIGNLSVFDSAGLVQVQIGQSDMEDFESYNAPVYQTRTTFSCLAPSVVTAPSDPPLSDVAVCATST